MGNKILSSIIALGLYLIPSNACKTKSILEVTDNTFNREVLINNMPVIVDFYTDWCSVCEHAKPYFESLSSEYSGKVKFVSYDADSGNVDENYNVEGYPTYILFINGREIGRYVGFKNRSSLEDFIEKKLE